MPLNWLRRFADRRNSPRPLGRRGAGKLRRQTTLSVESLEDRALMSATAVGPITPPPGMLNSVQTAGTANGKFYFTVDDYTVSGGIQKYELWASDGTPGGTVHLHDFQSNPTSLGPAEFTDVNGTLFFEVNHSSLWKSDGTAAGTVQVASFNYVNDLAAFNGDLYFYGTNGPASAGLWKSDGTAAGTAQVQNLIIYTPLVTVNGSLYFGGSDLASVHGEELWKSDGTAAGTALFKEIAPGSVSSNPYDLTAVGNKLFFEVANPVAQSGLWVSDGTAAGTVRLQQAVPLSAADMVSLNGTLFFINAGPTNPGLWKSDGTPAGTVFVSPINNNDGLTVSMTTFQGQVFYVRQTNGMSEMWKSDGTPAGTVMIQLPAIAQSARNLMNVNGSLMFTAFDPAGGLELWKSDGTSDGTVMLDDVAQSKGSVQTNVNGVLFLATADSSGVQVVRNDPSTGPTADAGGPYMIYAGESLGLYGLGSTGTTPAPNLTYSWTVNGHAVAGTSGTPPALNWAALKADGITGPGDYPIWLTVSQGGKTSTSEADLIVRSSLLNVTGVSTSADEGKAFNGVVAKITDPAGATISTVYNAQVDWGDGSAPSNARVEMTLKGLVVEGTHTYAEEGTYTVKVSVEKGAGLPNMVTTTVRVADAGIWTGREFLRKTEGQAFSGTVAMITDGSPMGKAGDFTATIKWGDGTTTTGTVTQTSPGKFAVQGGHTYAAAGSYTVTVVVKDMGGSTSTAKSTFLVDDAALKALPQGVLKSVPPPHLASQAITLGFTDGNPLATVSQFSVTINWGDGTSSPGTLTQPQGQHYFVVTGAHHYQAPGNFTATATVKDVGGSKLVMKTTMHVPVVDPPTVPTDTGKDHHD
jgi:ELWxxDGT repeat protein